MRWLGYALALYLAAAFVVAASAKLADLPATARAFRALGVPAPYAAAKVVAGAELAVAALLVVVPGIGSLVALGLLAVFTVFLADRLARGLRAPCACFGGRRLSPISGRDLARNGILAALAISVALLWGAGSGAATPL